MNKKSLLLSAILLGALLTPQKAIATPGFILGFYVASAFVGTYAITAIVKTAQTIKSSFTPHQKKEVKEINQLNKKRPKSKTRTFLIVGAVPFLFLAGPISIIWLFKLNA